MSYRGRQAFGFRVAIRTSTGTDAVKATLTKGTGNSKIRFTAKAGGVDGNDITVAAINPGSNATLGIVVTGTDIVINLGYSSSAIDSTVNDVIAALYADEDAAALIDVDNSDGTGAGLLAAFAEAPLASGADATHTFEDIPGIQDTDSPGLGRTELDRTSHSSPDAYAEYEKSEVKDGRSFTLPIKFDPENTAHQAILDAEASSDPTVLRFYYPFGDMDYESEALILDCPISMPVRDLMMMNVSVRLTGAPTPL